MTNLDWARNTVETLYRLGIKYACISPGSRNTPLTIAFIEHNLIQCHSVIDERSSGFFALGLAKTTRKPVIIITTSGTATANLYPSIIEANLSRVPLLILTADRPPHLIGTGANQTIDQQDIYGHQVRGFVDIGLPRYLENLLMILKKSYLMAMGLSHHGKQINPPGPVHLNFPFDEPIIKKNEIEQKPTLNEKKFSRLKIHKVNNVNINKAIPNFLINSILSTANVIIVCGEGLNKLELNHLIKFSEKYRIPIFADILSNLRFNFQSKFILCHYENYLHKISNLELIIRFGKKPNSKLLNQFLDNEKESIQLFDPIGRFNDDAHHIHSYSILEFPLNGKKINQSNFNKNLFKDENNSYSDHYIHKIVDLLPENSQLFIGNSLPIREFDKVVPNIKKYINILGNRGASGIDGIISSAIGMAIANPKKPTALVLGDVSFYYDMSAIQIAKNLCANLTIFVINNGGGQIFNKLFYADFNIKDFKKFWLTSPNLNIQKTADLFGFKYNKIQNSNEFEQLIIKKYQINEILIS